MSHTNRLAHETSPTCGSTPTTPSTGIPGGRRRSRRAKSSTGPSSSASATRRATGATSWSTRVSRTEEIGRHPQRALRQHQGGPRGAARPRPDLHDGRAAAQPGQGGWPMSVFLTPDLRAVLRRHLLPARRPLRPARLSHASCARSPKRGANRRDEVDAARRAITEAIRERD